ncbi:hypothetical protein CBR_g36688 [Chara braunii]|uniref:CCHC-type domain-containing protein n=1 Tax=Chara braunii TaxID=69332 RepID=A0A388LLE0_CHABU|nr:hypothetical protein CBR_g36688 [Chara braunii]|eukprot:GBG83071.1 hypothetical protein CBR_g36688 [Chara braunii]
MVDTRSGKSTTPYTQAQEEQAAAILSERKEKREKKEFLKQAKLKIIAEEQATKKKKLEEELKRVKQEEEEKMKVAEEEDVEEEEQLEEEQSLERRRAGGRGESSGTKENDPWVEKKISEWEMSYFWKCLQQSILTRFLTTFLFPFPITLSVGEGPSELRTRGQADKKREELLALWNQFLIEVQLSGPDAEQHIRDNFDLQEVEDCLKKSITAVEVVAAGTEASKLIAQGRQTLDHFALKQLEEIMEATRKGEVKPEVSEETIDVNIQQLRDTLAAKERKKEELVRRREQEQRRGQNVKEIRQVIGTEVGEQTDMSQTLAHIVTYLTFLEEKIDRQQNQLDEITVGLRTIVNIVKGKNQIQGEEEQEEKKEKKEVKKLMGDAIKFVGPMIKTMTNGSGSNGNGSSPPSTPHSSHSSKSTPKETPEKTSTEPEKPKKKEKVKMKLPFMFCNKKEESLLLWIAEIQTYVSTAPVEPESQVAFTTSCMGGEAKQWVLAEANAAGFEDIGEWAKTLTLKQFLAKTRDRFLDKTTADKAFDQLTSIGQKDWTSVEALSREVDRLLRVPGLNLQDSQVLYIYSRALPEPLRGHLVTEAKSAVVKSGGGGGRQYNGKRVLWRQKRQDHTLVVFDDDTVEKWPNEENDNNSDSGMGGVTAVVANKGGPPMTGGKKQRAFPWHPGIADGKSWVEMGMTRNTSHERMDNAQCLKCGTTGHVIAYCPQIRNPKANSQLSQVLKNGGIMRGNWMNNNGGFGNNFGDMGSNGGNRGWGGKQNGPQCYDCGKYDHIARECWFERGRTAQQDDEMHVFVIDLKEKAEERKRREEEHKKLREDEERRRETDMARRTEELRLQLQVEIVDMRKKQQAKAATKAREQESRQQDLKRTTPKNVLRISPHSKLIPKEKERKKKSKKQAAKTALEILESSTSTTEDSSSSASEKSSDFGKEMTQIAKLLKEEKKKAWAKKKKRVTKRTTKKGPIGTMEKGECSMRSNSPTPPTKGSPIEPRTPLMGGYKGIAAGCSKEGFMDYTLAVMKQYSAQKTSQLRWLCTKHEIKSTKKNNMVMELVRRQTDLAYVGFFGTPLTTKTTSLKIKLETAKVSGSPPRATKSSITRGKAKLSEIPRKIL